MIVPVAPRRKKSKPMNAPMPTPVEAAIEEGEEDAVMDKVIARQQELIQEYAAKITNPLTAIRANCVQCMGGMVREIANCPSTICPLYPFRMGKNPMHAKSRENRERLENAEKEETAVEKAERAETGVQRSEDAEGEDPSGQGNSGTVSRRRRKG